MAQNDLEIEYGSKWPGNKIWLKMTSKLNMAQNDLDIKYGAKWPLN